MDAKKTNKPVRKPLFLAWNEELLEQGADSEERKRFETRLG